MGYKSELTDTTKAAVVRRLERHRTQVILAGASISLDNVDVLGGYFLGSNPGGPAAETWTGIAQQILRDLRSSGGIKDGHLQLPDPEQGTLTLTEQTVRDIAKYGASLKKTDIAERIQALCDQSTQMRLLNQPVTMNHVAIGDAGIWLD